MIDRQANSFVWVGNHPGLDLVNTEAADGHGDRRELVPDLRALIDWAEAAGLADRDVAEDCRAASGRRGRAVVTWFRRLRACLRAVLESTDEERPAEALDTVLSAVPVRLCYRPTDSSSELPLRGSEPLDELRLVLAAAALDAVRLDRSRISRCGGARCVLLYYDTTKNRSRRWCDMAVCGNRAKARAHYRRTHALP